MRLDDYDLTVVEPGDSAVLEAWAVERAAAQANLAQALLARQRLATALEQAPAKAALKVRLDAFEHLARMQGEHTTAQGHADTAALTAARFAAGELVTATVALDVATRAVSDALAALLRDASTSVALTAAVDGLALRERYRAATAVTPPAWDHTTIPFPATEADIVDPELTFPIVDDAEGSPYQQVRAVLDRLDERVDAVADLVTAESVHQLVQGNATRSAASAGLAADAGLPAEFDVVRTPRRGHDVEYRVLVLIDPDLTPAWQAAQPSAAALADPLLAAWVSRLLPNPDGVVVRVRRVDPSTGTPGDELSLLATALGLDPLDWLRVAADPAELRQRIAWAARTAWAETMDPTTAATGQVDIDAGAFTDLVAAAAAAGSLLAAARALAADDLPGAGGPVSGPEFENRLAFEGGLAAQVRAAEDHVADILAALESPGGTETLLRVLFSASSLGVAEATPQVDGADAVSPAALAGQAAAARARLAQRTAGPPFVPDPADPAASLRNAKARLDALCGIRLPLLTVVPADLDGTLTADLGAGPPRLTGADATAVRTWLYDHARVRAPLTALLSAYDLAEALDTGDVLDLRVTQLTATGQPDTWIGADPAHHPGGIGLVVQRAYSGEPPPRVAGLVIDAWTEAVPATTHASALAFHYDRPNNSPPQALLIAVPPDVTPDRQPGTWDLDTLLEIITDTLALARDRAVAAELSRSSGLTIEETS